MRIVQRVEIDASPDEVWPYVADPVLVSIWNPKVVAVDRLREGPVETGEQFEMTYRMSRGDRRSTVEVLAAEAPCRLVIRHTPCERPERGCAVEHYVLEMRRGRTRLTQTLDLSRAGVPLWARPLIWLIMKLGKPKGTPCLELLRDAVESSGPDQAVSSARSDGNIPASAGYMAS
jgi:uncharacterized protein YndB with AHSA1/START domain